MSEGISRTKNIVIESLEIKQSIKMFKCFVNEEMKEIIKEQMNRYMSQNNNTLFQLTVSVLNTFNATLM